MRIKNFLFFFIVVLGLLFSSTSETKNNRKWYIILCSIILILVAALRNPEWMTNMYLIDTLKYKELFEYSKDLSWSEFFQLFRLRYFENKGDFDVGYYALNMVIGRFTNEFYVFSFVVDLIFFIPFGIILYRYCTRIPQIIFAYVYFISFLEIGLIAGGRQAFAIGFDMMALLATIDRKKWRAIILFVIGITIHFSSIAFIIPLIVIWFNINSKTLKVLHVVCFVLFPIVIAIPGLLVSIMGQLAGVERYSNYGLTGVNGGVIVYILLIESLSLFCLVAIKKTDLEFNPTIRYFYIMAPLFTLFAPLIRANGAMERITSYYSMYLVLLVPFAIDCMFKGKDRETAYLTIIAALVFLTVINDNFIYYFFWQK